MVSKISVCVCVCVCVCVERVHVLVWVYLCKHVCICGRMYVLAFCYCGEIMANKHAAFNTQLTVLGTDHLVSKEVSEKDCMELIQKTVVRKT